MKKPSRPSQKNFQSLYNKYEKAKKAHLSKLESLEQKTSLDSTVKDMESRNKSPLRKLKLLASKKKNKSSRTWECYNKGYTPEKNRELTTALHVLTKANNDLPRIEKEILKSKELPKHLKAVIHEYQSLCSKVDTMMATADIRFEHCKDSWDKYLSDVNSELSTKKCDEQTEYQESVAEYKRIRSLVLPLVKARAKALEDEDRKGKALPAWSNSWVLCCLA